MTLTAAWWHHPWLTAGETVVAHLVAIVAGFAMMAFGLALGVTMIMLPAGVAIGLAAAR